MQTAAAGLQPTMCAAREPENNAADGHGVKVRNMDVTGLLMRCSTLTFLSAVLHTRLFSFSPRLYLHQIGVFSEISCPSVHALWATNTVARAKFILSFSHFFFLCVIVVVKVDIFTVHMYHLFLLAC